MTLEKVQSKYDMVRSINSKEGEGYESPELKLILAAQKRQELQQEGDALDETIRTKEMEIRTMKNTLVQLQERNSNFRSSFSKADMNGVKAQELKTLECKVEESEDSLIRVRKELQVLQKCITEDRLKLDGLTQELTKSEEKSQVLARAKEKYESELERCNATLDGYNAKVVALQEICSQNSKSGQELQLKKFKAELVQIQSDRICKLLVHLGKEFPELRSDIMDELHKIGHET
jgi:chromosome segregation ATPase